VRDVLQAGSRRAVRHKAHIQRRLIREQLACSSQRTLGDLADQPLVLPAREQTLKLSVGMDMNDQEAPAPGTGENIGERERIPRALRSIDPDDDHIPRHALTTQGLAAAKCRLMPRNPAGCA
jgi:hypothetical protein